jgi:serine/threonine-protein kinase RsbW
VLSVPHRLGSASLVRQRLRLDLEGRGCERTLVDDAAVVVSELVGNAVRHARPLPDGSVLVEWHVVRGGVELRVTDGGRKTQPNRAPVDPEATGGRGLTIVDALTREWAISDERGRTTARAVL